MPILNFDMPLDLPTTSAFLTNTIDLAPTRIPQVPGAYQRISEDPLGLERGVGRQSDDVEQLRTRLGWGAFARVYRENDTSAFKKRRVRQPDGSFAMRVIRPEWTQMLNDLQSGVIDGIIVYDLDRLVRQPRDLEDLIDLIEHRRVPVQGVTSSIDLMSSNGRMATRMLVNVALKSSEDTSRRVARAAVADAKAGKTPTGGPRRFGWEKDGLTIIPAEAQVIRWMAGQVMEGRSISAVALDLQQQHVKTVQDRTWTRTTVNTVLRSPRLAGIRAYQGVFHQAKPSINDWRARVVRVEGEYVKGEWEPVLSVGEWEALQGALDGRRTHSTLTLSGWGRGNRKHLLTGLVQCGRCQGKMIGRKGSYGTAYGCLPKDLGGCNGVTRSVAKVDDLIMKLAIKYLETRGKVTVLDSRRPASPDVAKQIRDVTTRKEALRADWLARKIEDVDYYASLASLNAIIRAAEAEQLDHERLVRRPRARKLREELMKESTTNERKRAILEEILLAVTINPSSRGPHFSPVDIVPVWRPETE